MLTKRTLIIGASPNPERYSYKAAEMLNEYGHPTYAYGIRNGHIGTTPIETRFPEKETFDTVTMYIGPALQPALYQSIISLSPKRVIFNPGTENAEFEQALQAQGIEAIEACTLVMLRSNQF